MSRPFEWLLSLFGLVVLSPFLILVAVLIKLNSSGPVFFIQTRVGKNEVPFGLIKFRTMYPKSEQKGQLTIGKMDKRITPVGRFLRKYKLDELPQLLNILKGDMSLVGPRPEVPRYVAHYSQAQKNVLRVRPGITDPASIEFRNENEILGQADDPEKLYLEEILPVKLSLNLEYLRKRDFWSDMFIILRTIKAVFA